MKTRLLSGLHVFCGETIVPQGLTGLQLSFNFTVRFIFMGGNAMIILRQGKAKSILENSINSALTAVETYNRPRVQFRIENYIILMIIAWTKLFHAYFQSEIGERYFYLTSLTEIR